MSPQFKRTHTHIHTHTYIYIYIYIYQKPISNKDINKKRKKKKTYVLRNNCRKKMPLNNVINYQ